MLFSHLVEPPGPGRLSGRPQSIATIRTGVDPAPFMFLVIRPDTESINYNRRQAVYEAIPGHSEITVLCRAAFRPASCRHKPGLELSTLATRDPGDALLPGRLS